MSHRHFLKETLLYITALITCTLIFFFILYPGFNFHLPLIYAEDGNFSAATIKTIIETGWYLTNPALGAPGIFNLADFSQSDTANFLLIKLITLFSRNYAVVMNVFYFGTFLLSVMTSLFALRIIKMKRINALAVSLLFTFLPYHWLRGEFHLFLSAIYVVPLYFLLIVSVYRPKINPILENKFLLVALAIFCASSGVYYAFFAAFFLLLTGLFSWLEQGDPKKFFKACLLVLVITFTVVANIIPALRAHHALGANHTISRSASDAETFGLKINQIMLPIEDHRLPGFRKSVEHYNKISPLVNENSMSASGILASLGLLALLFILLMRRDYIENAILVLLSRLTVFGILLGTIGGLGAVFSYRVSPLIRSYNRISIFLGFFALTALFLILQRLSHHMNKKIFFVLVVALTVLGVLDQTPLATKFVTQYQQIQSAYQSDAQFVAQLETRLPQNARVFQLPYMEFPESPVIAAMHDYEPFRLYLHSRNVRWSYGAMKGRETAAWQSAVSQQSIPAMIKTLQQAGFAGLIIDRQGYADQGVAIERQLREILQAKPLISPDGSFVFFAFNFTPQK